MTDGDALLLAIVRDPDDDTPRLIYADWLEENGDPERAEFIRVQCELARLSTADPRWTELRRREVMLLGDSLGAWSQFFRRFGSFAKPVAFSRGFVDLSAFSNSTVESEDALAVVGCPDALWLTALHLNDNGHLTDRVSQAVAVSPYLQRLSALSSLGTFTTKTSPEKRLTAAGVAALASSPFLAELTELTLSSHGLDDAAAKALAASSCLARLECLDLRENAIGADGIAALAASPHLPQLTQLGLSENPGGPQMRVFRDWDGTIVDYELDREAVAELERQFGGRVAIY